MKYEYNTDELKNGAINNAEITDVWKGDFRPKFEDIYETEDGMYRADLSYIESETGYMPWKLILNVRDKLIRNSLGEEFSTLLSYIDELIKEKTPDYKFDDVFLVNSDRFYFNEADAMREIADTVRSKKAERKEVYRMIKKTAKDIGKANRECDGVGTVNFGTIVENNYYSELVPFLEKKAKFGLAFYTLVMFMNGHGFSISYLVPNKSRLDQASNLDEFYEAIANVSLSWLLENMKAEDGTILG